MSSERGSYWVPIQGLQYDPGEPWKDAKAQAKFQEDYDLKQNYLKGTTFQNPTRSNM